MNSSNSSDRRQFVRITPATNSPVRIDINGEDFIDILTATDISEGGIGITVAHGFKGCTINKHVSFVIELPSTPKNTLIQVQGKIKHVSGERFGVSFFNISELTKDKIKNYLAERLKEDSLVDWFKYKIGFMQ